MSWALFVDESGQDQRESPYEVLAGIAVEDRKIWPLIQQLGDAQEMHFGMRLFDAYEKEAHAKDLLKRKVFKHAIQLEKLPRAVRIEEISKLFDTPETPTKKGLTALAQSKVAYCAKALDLCQSYGAQAFASIVPQAAPRPKTEMLRKDYAYLFERFYNFLNSHPDDPMGYIVFDELDKSASHILLGQVSSYFRRTSNGRSRSRLIIPEPFFVHSDLTTMVQIADLIAYTISWGVRLRYMSEPARPELSTLAQSVIQLRYKRRLESGRDEYGFKVIHDLRAANA